MFVAFLAEENVAHRSIKSYLSAVRHLQISQGFQPPLIGGMTHLEQVLKGIESTQAKRGPKPRPRLPIMPDVLRKLRASWEPSVEPFDHSMLWAAAVVCFFGFFRAGELTVPSDASYDPSVHLNFGDVAVDSLTKPSLVCIRLKTSKTDPFREGVDVFIGPSGDDLCPVKALAAYLVARGGRAGMLFHFRDGRLLTRARFVSRVRLALERAGLNYKAYAGHSFRIGAATTVARCGLNEATIKLLGRWESAAYLLYVKTPREELARFSAALTRPC